MERAKVEITVMEKENPQRARARPTLALLSQMIVRFLWMESSFANDGRSDVALQRSNLENVAWLGTTCAGRSHVTNFTRAMNAHTDLVRCLTIAVSLWRP